VIRVKKGCGLKYMEGKENGSRKTGDLLESGPRHNGLRGLGESQQRGE